MTSGMEQGLTLAAFWALIKQVAVHNLQVSVNPIRVEALIGMYP